MVQTKKKATIVARKRWKESPREEVRWKERERERKLKSAGTIDVVTKSIALNIFRPNPIGPNHSLWHWDAIKLNASIDFIKQWGSSKGVWWLRSLMMMMMMYQSGEGILFYAHSFAHKRTERCYTFWVLETETVIGCIICFISFWLFLRLANVYTSRFVTSLMGSCWQQTNI